MADSVNVREYVDFTISISEARKEGAYNLRAVSGVKKLGSCEETMTLDVDALLDRLHAVSSTARPSQLLMKRDGDPDEPMVRTTLTVADTFGAEVCRALFTGAIKTLFDGTWAIALNEDKGVRIRLYIGTIGETMGKIAALPWEMMSSAERGTLALNPKTVFVRSMDVMQPEDAPSIDTGLRILVIASSPVGHPTLKLEEERARIKAQWGGGPDVDVEFESGSLDVLSSRLANEHFHVIHFMGHGAFSASTGKGALLFEGEGGLAQQVEAEEFARCLINVGKNPPRLVFLNACKSATTSDVLSTRPFGGMAQGLIAEGVPAVIAMQFPVGDDAAIAFSNLFYERAASGFPIDAAVAMARARMGKEWATPVLYMRAKDGVLFEKRAIPSAAEVSAARATPLANMVVTASHPAPPPTGDGAAGASGFTVFICPSTEPGDPVVGEIRQAMKRLGVSVVTVESGDPDSFRKRVQTLAQSADLTVHVMGATPGKPMDDGGIRTYPWEALRAAYTSARSQLVLQSADFEIDANRYAGYAEYMATFDSTSRTSERMEYARVAELEMAHTVEEKVRDMMKQAESAQASTGRIRSVFVDIHTNDGATMFSLQQYLQQRDIHPEFLASSGAGDTANIAKFEKLVANNPLCVVVFGNSPEEWARERAFTAVKSKFSARASTFIGVLAVEPKEKAQLDFQGIAKVSVTPPTFDPAALDALITAANDQR